MAKIIKKACKGVSYPKTSNVSSRLGSPGKAKLGTIVPSKSSVGKTLGKLNKAQKGTSLGMKSVKAGFDKNPGVTRADIIVAAKGQAKKGMKVKKAQTGTTQDLVNKAAATKPAPTKRTYNPPVAPMKKGGKMTKKCKYGCK